MYSSNHHHEINIRDHLQDYFEHISIAAQSDDDRLYIGYELETRIQNRRLRILSVEAKDNILNKLIEVPTEYESEIQFSLVVYNYS